MRSIHAPILYICVAVIAILSGLCFPLATIASEFIRIPSKSTKNDLPVELLREVVRRLDNYELSYPYEEDANIATKQRQQADLENDELDIIWSSTNPEYETRFLPIRIPIYRGLLGYRIALVKKDNIDIFRDVSSLNDLKYFNAGQGLLWADTQILRENGIQVTTSNNSANLFPMLAGDRFDFFPRGINQAWDELDRYSQYSLAVEPRILLSYRVPTYFFVSISNKKLWQLLNDTLEAMYRDKTFQKLFHESPTIKSAINNHNLSSRKLFELKNTLLSSETPINRKEFWFDPINGEFEI